MGERCGVMVLSDISGILGDPSADEVSLIGGDGASAVELVNLDGFAPFLLICDHASRAIPQAMDNLGLNDALLHQHIAYDIGTSRVTRRLSARFDAPLVMSNYSRLVIDVNREFGSPTSIVATSDGIDIPGNRNIDTHEAARRAEVFFWPYHNAISAALGRFLARNAVPAIVSIHSFTPTFNGTQRPWQIGVLWNKDGRIALPLMDALQTREGLCVGDNQPYSARAPDGYGEGYSMRVHGEATGYPHVLIEIRQDLIETDAGVARWADLLGNVLEGILASPDIYSIKD